MFVNIGKKKKFNFINFITPANDNISYLSSVFIAMEMMRDNYKNILANYSQILKPGMNVELCSNGKIYKFMGESKQFKGFVRIETIPLFPCLPAILSPGCNFRFTAIKTFINFKTPGSNSSPL